MVLRYNRDRWEAIKIFLFISMALCKMSDIMNILPVAAYSFENVII